MPSESGDEIVASPSGLTDAARRKLRFEQTCQALATRVAQLMPLATKEAQANDYMKQIVEILEWWSRAEQQVSLSRLAQHIQRIASLPALNPVWAAPPSFGTTPRTQNVSILALPPPEFWNNTWLARLKGMTAWMERVNCNLETGEKVEPPPQEWWLELVRRLKLSPGTLQRLQAADRLHRMKQAPLEAEQQRLTAQLAALMQRIHQAPNEGSSAGCYGQCVITEGSGSDSWGNGWADCVPDGSVTADGNGMYASDRLCWNMGLSEECEEVANALQRCTSQQAVLLAEHYQYIWRRVLTPIEVSESFLALYPYNFHHAHLYEAISMLAAEQEAAGSASGRFLEASGTTTK